MKQKTLIALVLTGMSGLGSCVNAQPGKQIIDLDRPDYSLDVAHFYSESLGADHSASGEGGTEAGYRRDTINTLGENPRPVIVFYRPQSDSLYKEATFFGLDFGKLEMAVNMQGRLIRTDARTETDEEGFGRMMEAVVRKYGEPVGKTMETGKENLDKILKQALEELSVYHWDVGDDEYIELAAERRSDPAEDEEGEPVQEETASPCVEVTFSRTKKEFDLLFKEVFSPLAEDTEELLKDLKEAEQENRQKWEESPKATSGKKE